MKISEARGVNLGGWLVLERWITPRVFEGTDATDEYSLCAGLGPELAAKRLDKHRESFITEETVARIAGLGLNTVRLPMGYWLFGGAAPFVDGASQYVDQLFDWAEKHSIGVILDIHAVPGSQNGWDHSGRAGEVGWHRDPDNIDMTLQFLSDICDQYGHRPSLIGVEVLNEPHWEVPLKVLVDYYDRAYRRIRAACPSSVSVIYSDAFRPGEMSRALARLPMDNVALDMHLYQLFTNEDRALDINGHMRKATKTWPKLIREVSSRMPVMVGEWSAALDQTRHQFVGNDYQKYAHTQTATFESHDAGWVYWTAKTQDGGAWSLLDHPEFIAK